MKTISYANIKVEGFAFKRILSIHITHRPNQHGMAVVEGEAEPDKARDFVNRVDEKMVVKITTNAEGQPKNLFLWFCKRCFTKTRKRVQRCHFKIEYDEYSS